MATAQNWGPMGPENAIGSQPIQRPFLEGAGQTYTTLDLVMLSGGYIIAVPTGTLAAGTNFMGYPDRDASGVQGTAVIVGAFQPGYTQRMPIYAGAAGNAVTVQTDVGTAYGLRVDPVQGLCVTKDEVGATKGRIIGIASDYPVGEANGFVDFEFFTANLQGAGV